MSAPLMGARVTLVVCWVDADRSALGLFGYAEERGAEEVRRGSSLGCPDSCSRRSKSSSTPATSSGPFQSLSVCCPRCESALTRLCFALTLPGCVVVGAFAGCGHRVHDRGRPRRSRPGEHGAAGPPEGAVVPTSAYSTNHQQTTGMHGLHCMRV